jgi:hypothetical protein
MTGRWLAKHFGREERRSSDFDLTQLDKGLIPSLLVRLEQPEINDVCREYDDGRGR